MAVGVDGGRGNGRHLVVVVKGAWGTRWRWYGVESDDYLFKKRVRGRLEQTEERTRVDCARRADSKELEARSRKGSG
jgi:hypothetical protein